MRAHCVFARGCHPHFLPVRYRRAVPGRSRAGARAHGGAGMSSTAARGLEPRACLEGWVHSVGEDGAFVLRCCGSLRTVHCAPDASRLACELRPESVVRLEGFDCGEWFACDALTILNTPQHLPFAP